MQLRSVVLTASMLSLAIAGPAFAAWPIGQTTNLPVCTSSGDQSDPLIAADGSGGAVVFWVDYRNGLADVAIQHVLATGTVDPAWPADGRLLGRSGIAELAAVRDGSGGAIVAWRESHVGTNWDIYAQHVLANGVVDPAWPAGGRALCTAVSDQYSPRVVADGSGGAVVAWQDYRGGAGGDIYAHHVLASGAVDPAWPADGRALCTATDEQFSPVSVSDGAGGALVSWADFRSGLGTDIYAQHVLASGAVDPAWPVNGRAVCTAASDQTLPSSVSDGSSGAIVAWQDYRPGLGTADLYAHHVLAGGALDPAWPAGGRGVCTATGNQSSQVLVADGSGGALIAWVDIRSGSSYDIYAHHVLSNGAMDPVWPASGRAICALPGNQSGLSIVSDGSGGALLAWHDLRDDPSADLYVQHLLPSGAADPEWPTDGRAVCTALGSQLVPTLVEDGLGGAIVAWMDGRNGPSYDIYAQRVEHSGQFGDPAPAILSVSDMPADQGGRVRISWSRSYLDSLPTLEIALYGVWRLASQPAASRALAMGAELVGEEGAGTAARPGVYRLSTLNGQSTYWEGVGTVAARGNATYSFVAQTEWDSTAADPGRTVFMVDAHLATLRGFFDSAPDSGSSVDNIAPATPLAFAGAYAAGSTSLQWNPNIEADLAGYRVHRGYSASFVPGPANLIATLPLTSYIDAAGGPAYYRLAAIDIHGNASPTTLLLPSGALAVDGALPATLAFAPPQPNPARGATTLRFALPREAHVRLSLYDVGGRRVRTLVQGARAAGTHTATWDLRDDAGHAVGAGLYLARLEAEGRTFTQRVMTLR